MKNFFFFIAISALFFYSCVQEPFPNSDNGTLDSKERDVSSVVLSGDGEEKAIKASMKGDWTANAAPSSWLSVSPKSGSYSTTITVKALPNKSSFSRSGTIILTSRNENKTITIKQNGTWLQSNTRSFHFSSAEGTDFMSISSSGKWKAIASDSWIEITPSSGKGDADIIVALSDNPSAKSREGEIVLSSSIHSFSIPVTQDSRYLRVNTDSIHISKSGGTQSIEVITDGNFELSADVDWISVNKGKGSFTITALENLSPDVREASFSIYLADLKEGKIVQNIYVIQDGQVYGKENGHDWVDLSLPSGTLWATLNLGEIPSENEDFFDRQYGDYYAWGETKTKNYYGHSWAGYRWSNGINGNVSLTKYNTSASGGKLDSKTQLDLEDDAAHVNWGGKWRMPSKEDWEELNAECECKYSMGDYIYTSKINGESIHLPCGGYVNEYEPFGVNELCYYWSSTLDGGRPLVAWYFHGGQGMFGLLRCYGLNIRPVCHP